MSGEDLHSNGVSGSGDWVDFTEMNASIEQLTRQIVHLKRERSLLAISRENLERTLINTQINRDALSARVQELERELTIAYTRDPPRKPSPPPPSSRRRTQRGLDTTMREDDSPGVE